MADRLRWGVLGTAYIVSAKVIPAIQGSSNRIVVALASREPEKGRAAARELDIDRVHDSYEALIEDPEVDVIYNPLPNALHAEWTIRAAEAERVVAACVRHGVPLMEAFMYRFHPQNVRVRELLADGAIGEVDGVYASLSAPLLNAPEPTNVRLRPELGGGTLLDMGCYTMSAARMAFSEEPLRAVAWHDVDDRFGVDVAFAGILEFSGRRPATVSCSFKAGNDGWYRIVGSAGVIEVPQAFIPGYGQRVAETMVIIADAHSNRHEEHFPPTDHYRLMVEAFAAAVLSGQAVPFPPEDAVRNMRVLDTLAHAAKGAAACFQSQGGQ